MVFTPRRRSEFERFFDGLELVPPGIVPVVAWRPDGIEGLNPQSVYIYAGVALRP